MDETSAKAKTSPRLRMNYNFHPELSDKVQRFINAMEPGTIVDIHHHQVDEMITQTVTDNPQVSQNSILVAARAVINLGKASKGEELLAKLAQMSLEEIDSLNRLLSKWTVRDALTVLDEIDKRLTVIEAVRKLCDDKNTDELELQNYTCNHQ